MLAWLAVVRPRGTAEPIQGRLNDRIPSRREDRVAAWNSHIRREAARVLPAGPVGLYSDGQPQRSAVGELKGFIHRRSALCVFAKKTRTGTAAKGDRDRFAGAARAVVDQHRDLGHARKVVRPSFNRRVSIHLAIVHFCRHAGTRASAP
jgi:hypothetical protein